MDLMSVYWLIFIFIERNLPCMQGKYPKGLIRFNINNNKLEQARFAEVESSKISPIVNVYKFLVLIFIVV
jgi:hypothetical protein